MDTALNLRRFIVRKVSKEKESIRNVSRLLNIARSTVQNVLRVYRQTGNFNTRRRGRCGRPPAMSVQDKRALLRKSQADPQATASELRASCPPHIANLSLTTIEKALREGGRLAYRPVGAPNLNEREMKTRLDWCNVE